MCKRAALVLGTVALFVALQTASAQSLINIDFGVGTRSGKVGFAATGQGTNDFWNLYRHYEPKFLPGMPLVHEGTLASLKYADGAESKVAIAVTNAPGVWGNATGDPMYDTYVFSQNGSNIVVTISGLEVARYHFYLYGHADPDVTGEQNSVFHVRSGTNNLGPLSALGSAGWRSTSPWQERYQYVVFRDVPVAANEPVVIEVAAGPNGIPVLNGMQIISRGTSPPRIIPAVAAGTPTSLTNLIFKSIQYDGRVTDTEARFTVKLEVESLATNEISGPLFEGDVAVVAPNIPDGLRIVSAAKQYGLVATKPGNYQLQLELVAKITRAEPWNQISFVGPPAAISEINAQASTAVEMQLLSGTQLQGERKAISRVEGFLGADRTLAMRWQSKTTEIARKSLVTVDTQASAMVTPTVIKFTTHLNYEILQAGVPRVVIQLPEGQTITRISGEQIRDWNLQTNSELHVEFIKPVEKAYALVLHTEQSLESAPLTALQVPRPMNVERESGSFSVSADDMLVDVESLSGLRQVNATAGTVAAFRFHGRPFSLSARLKRIEPVVKVADRVSVRLEETRLLLKHAVTLTVEKAGIYSIEFTPQAGFTVSDVKGEGIDDWKMADGRLRISFANRVLGTRQLEAQLEQAQSSFPQQFAVMPLRAPIATNETAQIGAGSALGIRLKTGELQNAREIPVQTLAARGEELLAFQSEQRDWQVTIAAERLPARIVAEVFNLVTVGDGLVGGSATVRYGLINQGVQDFRVQLPAHWKNVEFTAPNIRRKELIENPADTNNAVWAITLQDKAWGGYTLVITYDYQFDPQRARLDLRGAHAVGVERETGSVAVTTAASLKLEPRAVTDPLRVIDQSELSGTDRGMVTRPVLLAYRYSGVTPLPLMVDVTRHAELPVLEAVADRTQLTSVVTEEGQMLTQASFMVKNNEKQYQKFQLPKGAKLWGCYVNNQSVKGELDGEWLAVSLPRGANRDEAFAVDIVYAQTFEAVKAGAFPRSLALAAPKSDVPNTYAEWQVFVPPSRRLSGFGGNMAVARGTTYGLRDGFREFTDFYTSLFRAGGGALIVLAVVVVFLGFAFGSVKRRGLAGLVPVLVVTAILAIMAGMLLPALSKAKARAQRISSMSSLKQIGVAARLFAQEHGRMPMSFEEMKNELGGNERVLVDPTTQQPFIYVGAGKKADDARAIVAYSPVEDAGVRLVCFADGSVAQLKSHEFAEALQRDASGSSDFAVLAEQQQAVRGQQDRFGTVGGAVVAPAQVPALTSSTSVAVTNGLPMAAGIRSIRIDVPRSGQAFTFTKVLNVTNEPLAVNMSVMKFRWFVIWRSVLQFTAFVIGLAIVAYQWRFGRSSLGMAVGLALSLGAVTHLLVSMRVLHLALIAVVLVVALGAVIWFFRKYWPRREAAIEAPTTGAAPAVTALAIAFTLALLPQASASPVTNTFSIVSAEYTGKVQDNVGQFAATIQVATFATNQIVPLFGEDVAIQEFSGDARLLRSGKTVGVRIGPEGNTRLHFKLAVKLGGDVTKRQLAFAIPPALSSKLAVAIDEPDADVEFPTAVAFGRKPGDNQTQVDAVLGSGDRVDLHWTPRVKRITEMAASIFVQNHSLVTVAAGVVNTRSVFDYQISQGELRQAKIQIPASQRLLRVEGELLRTWELHEEGNAQVLVVDLVKGVAPAYRLTVETEKILEALPAQVQAALPHAMNVIRETGIVGVRGGEELTLTLENTPELQRVDNAEFEKAYPGKGASIVSAYRFLKPGFQFTARAEPVTPQIEAVVRNAFRVGFEQLTLNTSVEYVIKKAGVFALRLALPAGYKVESVTGGSNVLHWVEKEQNTIEVTLKQRTGGNYSLALQLARVHKEPPRTLELRGVIPLDVQKLTGFVSATSDQGIALKTSTFTGLIEIPASALGEGRGSVLAFKHLATDGAWQLALATELVESWVRAEVVNIISVSETLLSGRAVIRYDIQNAPVKEFRLRVPPVYKNVEILGTNIRRRDQTGEVWRVELQAKERGTYTLTVTFEQARDGRTNSAVELAGIETLGTERETGAMVILAKPPLQVVEKAASEQMLKIDARELPDWAGVSGDAPALVYRYLRPGYKLALEAKRFDEAAVLRALIDSALFTTVIADDGQMMTEMSLRIRNNGLQHLEIELPPQTEVWSAFVGGQPVRPAKRGTRLLLPLERSAQDASVAVQLTYVGSEKFPKTKGAVNLASPRLDVPLKNARWEVYLPPDYDYSKFSGTMMHEVSAAPVVKVYSSSEYAQQEQAKKYERSSESKRSLGRARNLLSSGNVKDANEDLKQAIVNAPMDELTRKELEGLKREVSKAQSSNLIEAQRAYTADNARRFGVINESAPAEQPVKLLDYDAEVAERQWEVLQKAQEVSVTKVQPLRVNLPTRGLRHSFTQVLQTEVNKPMTVQFRADNLKDGGWLKLALNGVAAFLLLWMLTAVVLNRAPKPAEAPAAA